MLNLKRKRKFRKLQLLQNNNETGWGLNAPNLNFYIGMSIMKYEFDIDWHNVEDISDDVLKELLPKDDDIVRRNSCLVKYKNGDIKAFYIISTADMIKVNEQFHEPHPFKGFEFHIFKEKSVTELKDEDSIIQYLKSHRFLVFKMPFIKWRIKYIYEDFEQIAPIPDDTILKDIIRQFL